MANDFKYIGPALYGLKRQNASGQSLDFSIIKILFNNKEAEITPSIQKDVALICESIWRILTTTKGERVYLRDFGCDLNKYIFEPLDDILIDEVKEEVLSALTSWEPRILVNSVIAEKTGEHELSIVLVYTILLDRKYTVTSSFYLK